MFKEKVFNLNPGEFNEKFVLGKTSNETLLNAFKFYSNRF